MRGLAGRAGRPRAGRRRAAGQPGSVDPDHRWDDGPAGRAGGPEAKQVVAHPQRFRPSRRTLRPLRVDRSASGRCRLDRIPGNWSRARSRIADRAYLQADRIAPVLAAGADILVRAGWKNARWLDADGEPVDLLAELRRSAACGLIDRPIWIGRKRGPALGLRLVAVKRPAGTAQAARRKARRNAQREGYQVSTGTLIAADWSDPRNLAHPGGLPDRRHHLALYRLRWRIGLTGFKRLKSLIGLRGPPGADERSARPYVLAHLLIILLLEPLVDELEDSPLLGPRRLTPPGAWRWLSAPTRRHASFQAIIPQPTLARLRQSKAALRRHLHEPPRRRHYQTMTRLF